MSKNYYDMYLEEHNKNSEKNIRSDLMLVLLVFRDLLKYFIMLVPNILILLFCVLTGKSEKIKIYFGKVVFEPFLIFVKIKDWFLEAKITSFLIFFLIFMYIVEILFLGDYMELFMVHPNHLFDGNYWSIFTSIFLHADLVHLVSNSIALLIFGRIVERKFNSKILFIFLLSGVVANLVSNFISYSQGELFYSLGASGAIAGLIILAILVDPFDFTTIFLVPLPIFVVGWFLISLDIIGLTNSSQTNHFAHLGGYLALLVIFFFLEFKDRKKVITGFTINLCLLLALYVLSQAFNLRKIAYAIFGIS
ncbi:MAG: rhomboid family intramembrane serine protease [Candidatus Woesearchaeota archaeon]|jgi:rhomboid protease GluP|nr:rhomboid family intramembrane serine protease [Candidatus Woesearchaeota archaeon]